ncbi:DNA cytosine methyltransferase [Desulforhopalus singaporensis]|uniref:DNA (cytosine-5-)-methyltransferase n=1 Tax=Desulforhopalus singaporensis TaxID=91360 RepID=A0A1H0RHH8_9BACT|nr:DNA cytosine methyltransferase [Desulforhopalus singaporensis]SDP28974.1 DNA (cytosine-5)-methyltransferase 1 [Desulforhopalus singaporensis]SDP69543.1 DNA (cytosine-5)-methyltransferase 1 [Desulforhopalus singaporensis]
MEQLNELALFAGAGGGILGGKLLGWRTVCAVEVNAYAASVLVQRQNDGLLQPFPVWDDVCTFDGKPWNGIVDVVSGGFPCQDISAAGKGAGITGERSGLWKEFARIIREVGPRFIFVENSPVLTARGIDVILGDLAQMGFDAEWGVLSAAEVGAPHKRDRIWIVGNSIGNGRNSRRENDGEDDRSIIAADGQHSGKMANTMQPGRKKQHATCLAARQGFGAWGIAEVGRKTWWATEPNVGRVAHGVAARVDRLKAIGNGQVPLCAAEAFRRLIARD